MELLRVKIILKRDLIRKINLKINNERLIKFKAIPII